MSNVNNTIPIGNVSGRPKTRRISSLPILSILSAITMPPKFGSGTDKFVSLSKPGLEIRITG